MCDVREFSATEKSKAERWWSQKATNKTLAQRLGLLGACSGLPGESPGCRWSRVRAPALTPQDGARLRSGDSLGHTSSFENGPGD